MADCKNCRRGWQKCKQAWLEMAAASLGVTVNDFQQDAFESLYFGDIECTGFRKQKEPIQLINFDDISNKNILMMGAPFAGKSVLIEELDIAYNYTVYGMGEYCRKHFAQTDKIEKNPTALTLKMLKEAISTFDLGKKFIIDNPIKNIKQYPVLSHLKNKRHDFIILNVVRNFEQDLNSRGRPDDIYLQDKINHYYENMPQVLDKIKKSKFQMFTVENNGSNFTRL